MNTQEILERLDEEHEGLLKANGFDDAILGVAEGWFGHAHHCVVCYDYDKCVEILMTRDGMSDEDANEWLQFNTLGAYVGEYTPVFLYNMRSAVSDAESAPQSAEGTAGGVLVPEAGKGADVK